MLMQLHQYVIRWNPRNSDTPQQFCHFRIARSIRHTALLLKTGKASRLRDIRFYVLNLTPFFFSPCSSVNIRWGFIPHKRFGEVLLDKDNHARISLHYNTDNHPTPGTLNEFERFSVSGPDHPSHFILPVRFSVTSLTHRERRAKHPTSVLCQCMLTCAMLMTSSHSLGRFRRVCCWGRICLLCVG